MKRVEVDDRAARRVDQDKTGLGVRQRLAPMRPRVSSFEGAWMLTTSEIAINS